MRRVSSCIFRNISSILWITHIGGMGTLGTIPITKLILRALTGIPRAIWTCNGYFPCPWRVNLTQNELVASQQHVALITSAAGNQVQAGQPAQVTGSGLFVDAEGIGDLAGTEGAFQTQHEQVNEPGI